MAVVRAHSQGITVLRRGRERIQSLCRRLCKPRLRGLVFYAFLLFLFLLGSFSPLSPFTSLPPNPPEPKAGGHNGPKASPLLKEGREKRSPPTPLNPHNFHMMISNSRLCADVEEVQLLILVTSSAPNFERRRAIRTTWGAPDHLLRFQARLVFLLANPNDSKIQRQIVEEYRSFGDSLQEDFFDSYLNLTLKTVMGLKWASSHCPKASFVMKTDDDIFVNVPLLHRHLQDFPEKGMFTGCIKQKKAFKPVNPDLKSFLPVHPLFAAGAGYVFSGSLLTGLFEASLRTRIIPVEDVYVTGHLAKMVNAHPPIHDERFSCGELVFKDCHMTKLFTGHKITPERMHRLWSFMNSSDKVNSCN